MKPYDWAVFEPGENVPYATVIREVRLVSDKAHWYSRPRWWREFCGVVCCEPGHRNPDMATRHADALFSLGHWA